MKFKLLIILLVIICTALTGCNNKTTNGNTPSPEPNGNQDIGLKVAFKNHFLTGSALSVNDILDKDNTIKQLAKKEFNTITPENCMKAEVVNPKPGVYDFKAADAFVAFGQENDMYIIGHTLIWHNQTPDWFFTNTKGAPNSPEEQKEQLRKHIEAVAGRYAGKVHAWDVVNEVIDDGGSYRPTTWVNSIGDGDEMVKLAFKYASEFAPNTELYYNDFNAWRPEKRDGIVRMIKMLQDAGIRIDGIGIQAHWGLNFPKNEYIQKAIDAYAALGVKVMITELDVDVLPLTKEGQIIGRSMMEPQFQLEEFKTFLDPYKNSLPESVEQDLANRYKELFEIFVKNSDKIDRVTFWGMHDGMSWKNDYPIPNRTNYPLLYNRDMTPKLARQAVLESLK
ncbi:endo-1,4-beta-xylanase [Mariniflexile sp. AS56]|uniref:endo-1,4-beta-xylanase n=1 Tax=Mariniflexile sp. AS56 TaxID=3063957 RepID=UPI0026EE3498|nr:endo-1,4-beta-xylanase [Mariniflexile sp. AS56]MDO7173747.1 endo-1,4-beta-xylanase [Mariniflexile sp. AS56]